jgi:pimeloyl-ACP methyl ester carboxylesterase
MVDDSMNTQILLQNLSTVVSELDLPPKPQPVESVARRRRRRGLAASDVRSEMMFVERDGVLRLVEGSPPREQAGRRRRRGVNRAVVGGKIVGRAPFDRLPRSDIKSALERLDRSLTPNVSRMPSETSGPKTGLRELVASSKAKELVEYRECKGAKRTGKILLLVHGTFSNTDKWIDEMRTSAPDFLKFALREYQQILTFDHRTLGSSPILNARELGLAMQDTPAKVDIVCHSRGGLVARWWLEVIDRAAPKSRRCVFVGAPLAGTGLAAAPNIRGALSMFANISRVLGTASAAVPFLTVATGLFQIVSSVASLTAKTPVVDAAIALVPGLDAQSRVGNNREINSLRSGVFDPANRYFAVQSNFESEAVGWRFWKAFRNIKTRVMDVGADTIFDGNNDLVVDTQSMSEFSDTVRLPVSQVLDFGTNSNVHHTNYFQFEETMDFIQESFSS